MKEIGGYFQLEEMPGEEYYPDLFRVNLGRTALLWLLKSRRCRKILLPYFLCESVVHTCQENQIETEFYHLNEKLEVLYPKEQLPEGEYLYLVNYYGQLSGTSAAGPPRGQPRPPPQTGTDSRCSPFWHNRGGRCTGG